MATIHADAKHPKNTLAQCFPCIPAMQEADAAAAAKAEKQAAQAAKGGGGGGGGGGGKKKVRSRVVYEWTTELTYTANAPTPPCSCGWCGCVVGRE